MTYTNFFPLPGPDGLVELPLTLPLVALLEETTSLLKTAERLAAQEMKVTEMICLLRCAYGVAGMPDIDDDFLLRQSPALLLAELLLAILSPLGEMGMLTPGKPRPVALEAKV